MPGVYPGGPGTRMASVMLANTGTSWPAPVSSSTRRTGPEGQTRPAAAPAFCLPRIARSTTCSDHESMNDTADRSTSSSAGSLADSAASTSSTAFPVTSASPDSTTTAHRPPGHGGCSTDTDNSATPAIMAARAGSRDNQRACRLTASRRPVACPLHAGAGCLLVVRGTIGQPAEHRAQHPLLVRAELAEHGRLGPVSGGDELVLHARARLGQPGDPGAPVTAVLIAGDQACGLEPVEQRGHRGLVKTERVSEGELRLARPRGDGGQHDPG